MSKKVERIAGPLRDDVRAIAETLNVDGARFRGLYAPRVGLLGFHLAPDEVRDRAAWALAAQWLIAYAAGAIARDANLAAAESWFQGGVEGLPRIAPDGGLSASAGALSAEEAFALLPYLLDQLSPGTRRDVLKNGDSLGDRRARKAAGVYYTPADLAQYMADAIDASSVRSCLDPACGSGVFLRAARARCDAADAPTGFGCDVAPLAAEQCAFVMLATDLREPSSLAPWKSLASSSAESRDRRLAASAAGIGGERSRASQACSRSRSGARGAAGRDDVGAE